MTEESQPDLSEVEKDLRLPEVIEISETEFAEKRSQRPIDRVKMYQTIDVSMDIPTRNSGAGPCLIVWIYDADKREMLKTAHYPNVISKDEDLINRGFLNAAEEKHKENNPQEIRIPNDSQTRFFSTNPISGLAQYEELLAETHDLVEQGKDLHIYLFGQNYYIDDPVKQYRDESIVSTTILHNDVVHQFHKAGIGDNNIHDKRKVNEDGVDNTLYDPKANKIYHYRKDGIVYN